MDTIEFLTSNRGRPIVIRQGHTYNLVRETDIETFRRCNFFYKTKCKCRLQTFGSTVLKCFVPHNHLAEPENAEKQKAYAELKRFCHNCDTNKFSIKLFHQVEMQPKHFFPKTNHCL